MPLSLGHSPWLLALCALVAAGLTAWTYGRTVPPLPAGWKALLGGLRFAALLLILFLLFEPILRHVQTEELPPTLAVLVDDSESLRLTAAGDGADSLAARPAVQEALRGLRADLGDPALRFFSFGQALRALPGGERALLDSLRFDGARTDMAAALGGVRERLRDENLRGVVLLSDGQYNAGRNPLYLAERSPVPIHTVVLGDTARQRDVQVRRAATNDLAYVDAELPVQAAIQADGYGGERVQVVLAQNGERLDAQRITLPPGGAAEALVDLAFTPDTAGLQRLVVGVSQLDGEATYRNNTQTVTVRVLESRRRVLLLGAAPTPTVAAARQLLEQVPSIEVEARIAKAAGAFYEGPLPDDLSDFDVAVLAGFPGSAAAPEDVRRVAEAAAGGLPLVFLLDQQTDLGAVRTFLADALPATPEAVRPGFVEATFAPTPRAQQHPLFDLPEGARGQWSQLPPLLKSQSRWRLRPDAQVLATATVRGAALEDPLLVVRRRAGQRSAALLGAGTWRWKNVPEGLEAAAPLWPALFTNAVQWASARDDDRPVRVAPAQTTFAGGEPVVFNGQVYDESLQPVGDASVQITVTGPEGNRFPYQMEATGNGRYAARAGTLPEGTYTYTATAERSGDSLGTDRGSFAVGGLTLEFRDTRADAALMRQIAERSGGTFRTAAGADALPAQLASAGALEPLLQTREEEEPLWHIYYFLAAIILLLGAEWLLRKRRGLV